LNQLSGYIPELAIASAFARKCDVELGGIEGPDFYVNSISVEVSRLTHSKNPQEIRRKLVRKVAKERRQGEIVAIDVTNTSLGISMWSKHHRYDIHKAIEAALRLAKLGKRATIAFTYQPNTLEPIGITLEL